MNIILWDSTQNSIIIPTKIQFILYPLSTRYFFSVVLFSLFFFIFQHQSSDVLQPVNTLSFTLSFSDLYSGYSLLRPGTVGAIAQAVIGFHVFRWIHKILYLGTHLLYIAPNPFSNVLISVPMKLPTSFCECQDLSPTLRTLLLLFCLNYLLLRRSKHSQIM